MNLEDWRRPRVQHRELPSSPRGMDFLRNGERIEMTLPFLPPVDSFHFSQPALRFPFFLLLQFSGLHNSFLCFIGGCL